MTYPEFKYNIYYKLFCYNLYNILLIYDVIEALYGRRTLRTFAALRVKSNVIRPIACNPKKVDAVLTAPDGTIFVFKG